MILVDYGYRVPRQTRPPIGNAFLLAQIGARAADRFAQALAPHDLTPPLVGIMRSLVTGPGASQQQLAERFGMAPSRMVALVDDLEGRGWIRRERDANDRRVNVISLTDEGRSAFGTIAAVAQEHERHITAALDDHERSQLHDLLSKLAASLELTPAIHPGYRTL